MRVLAVVLLLLLPLPAFAQPPANDPASSAASLMLPAPETAVNERAAEGAAQQLMDKLDVNKDGIVDMSDAETVISQGIGTSEQLAINGAMRYDLNGDDKITPAEVETFARRYFDLLSDPATGRIAGRGESFEQYLEHDMQSFRLWDLNHDGIVTRKEVETFMLAENQQQIDSVRREFQDYMRMMDANKDGKITMQEMKEAYQRAQNYPRAKPFTRPTPSSGTGLAIDKFVTIQANAILKEFDAGPSESISREQAVIKGGRNCYLLSMDQEGDGTINRAKIERRARAAAAIADVDKDGLLSMAEMADAWAMLHGLRPWKFTDADAPGPDAE